MKVCQINCVYENGSTGHIVRDIHLSLLEKGVDSFVICPISHSHDPNIYTVSNYFASYASAIYRRILGRQFDGARIQTDKILEILRKQKPNVVHLHCINGNNINIYRILHYLAIQRIPTVVTLHAEFMYTGGCGHAYDCEKWKVGCGNCPNMREATQSILFDGTRHTWKSLKKCYSLFEKDKLRFTAVSPWLLSRAEQAPMLLPFQKETVLNGIDTSIFFPHDGAQVRKELGISIDDKIILHVTANFDPTKDSLKGGKFIIDLANRLKDKHIRIVVAANYSATIELPKNIVYVGRISDSQKLAGLYSAADLTVIVSKRETFSMPIAESLCCGTPVIGFKAGGPESIGIEKYTEFVPYADIEMLSDSALKWLKKQSDNKGYSAEQISTAASNVFSIERIVEQYYHIYETLCNL